LVVENGSSQVQESTHAEEGYVSYGRKRIDLGGVLVDAVSLSQAAERIQGFVDAHQLTGACHQVVTVNLDFLSLARQDAGFRDALNHADLAVPDGMPLVWLSRLTGEPLAERVTGVALVDESCRLAALTGRGVFLLGAAPGVADAAGHELQRRFPGLRIAGTYAPRVGPLSVRENDDILDLVRRSAPDFLFVALGAPRQDLWIREHLPRLGVAVAMGVGCVFDVLAGVVGRAPTWMQQAGLEWAYRLQHEPRRLWRRYLVDDTRTLGHLVVSTARLARSAASAS
jgi:N-acetylglucosaminyldiphosphoundecaprenol N-acetyl-beta-D-mannosaminyltransferase